MNIVLLQDNHLDKTAQWKSELGLYKFSPVSNMLLLLNLHSDIVYNI